MDLLVTIATLVGVLESYMFMFCGFRLVGFTPASRKILVAGALHAVSVRMVRHLFYTIWRVPFGAHIVFAIGLFFLISYIAFRLPVILAALATVIGYLLLSAGTMLVTLIIPSLEPMMPLSIIALMLVEQIPLITCSLLVWRTQATIVPETVGRKLGLRR